MQFAKATKRQAKLRLDISGVSGSGKTYTSLTLASYLGNKVAVIDTEHGSASKYADKFNFDVLELDSFHPQKYIEAIHAAEQAGYDVLIIDSLSHAWSGKDGALELVDRAAKKSGSGNKFMAWGDVTPLQNQLVDTIIAAKMHVIATMRSKTEYTLQDYTDGSGRIKQKPVKLGLAPIQRDGMEYEFDIVGEMDMQNKMTIIKSRASILNGSEIEKPSKELAEMLLTWLSDGTAQPKQPAPIVSTAPANQTVDQRAQAQAASKPTSETEHAELGEKVVPGAEGMNLKAGGVLPPKGNGHDPLESLRKLETMLSGKAWTPDDTKRDKQQIVFALKGTAIGDDEEMRHAFRKELFGDTPSALQYRALKDWIVSEDAKKYIADWVSKQKQTA